MSFHRPAVLMAASLVAALCAPASHASPQKLRIAIYDAAACSQTSCPESARVAAGSSFAGTLAVLAHAEDPLGLRRIRIEASIAGDPKWYCVGERDVSGDLSADERFPWDTRAWPAPETGSGCQHLLPHIHGTPTSNRLHALRVTAMSLADDQDLRSSESVNVSFANPAAAPRWAADPKATGARVGLSWVPNEEPDLTSYRIVRTGPVNTTTRFVSATHPERDGCTRFGEESILCPDTPHGSGTYTYTLHAVRPGGKSPCGNGKATCLWSAASEPRPVSVQDRGAASPEPSSTVSVLPPSASPGEATASPSFLPFEEELPGDGSAVAAPENASGSSGGLLAVSAALLALGALGGVVWFRLRSSGG